jgi:hypothetical protein
MVFSVGGPQDHLGVAGGGWRMDRARMAVHIDRFAAGLHGGSRNARKPLVLPRLAHRLNSGME